MLKLENSVKLYKMMHERCAASGFCEHQAKVYTEMVDFIAACDSVEDSMQKIKNSEYYLAPSAALVKDKLEAEKKFATQHDMQDLADVYDTKIREIDKDVNGMYTNDYSSKAQTIKSDYVNSLTAFGNIFVSYVTYNCSGEDVHVSDFDAYNKSGIQDKYTALITKVAMAANSGSQESSETIESASQLPSVSEFLEQYRPSYDEVCKRGGLAGKKAYEDLFDIANKTDDLLEAQIIIEETRIL